MIYDLFEKLTLFFILKAVPVSLSALEGISHIRLVLPKEVRSNDAKKSVLKSIREVKKRFPDNIPLLDPVENMNIKDPEFKKLVAVSYSIFKKKKIKWMN